MLKEIVISIIIVISIVSLDFLTQNYTEETVTNTSEQLTELKTKIKNDEEGVLKKLEEVEKSWKQRRGKLAYFIEHDELEKVETNLTNIKSFIEEDEHDMAISSIDEAEFILEHIKEKNAFNLENIF